MKDYLLFVRQYWAVLAFGFLAVFWGNFGQSFFVSWFGAEIQRTLNLTASQYGSAYSFATLCSAATIVWAGGWIDRISLRRYTAIVCLGLAAACCMLWQASGYIGLMLGFFLLRLFGQALMPHAGSTTMARVFDAHRGKALSIASSGFPVGEVVLPGMVVALIAFIGWQLTFFSIGVAIICIVLPLMLWLISYSDIERSSQIDRSVDSAKVSTLAAQRALLSDSRYWKALPGLMAGPFIVTGIFIHQNFIITSKDWSPAWLATCFVIYGVVHWLSSLIAGLLVDKFKAVKLLPFFLLPMLMALIIVAYVPGDWLAIAVMGLLATSIGFSSPITGSLWPEMYGVQNLGAIRSLNIAVMVFATSVSPILFGYCIDIGVSLQLLMSVCAGYLAFASVLMAFSYTANPEKTELSSG